MHCKMNIVTKSCEKKKDEEESNQDDRNLTSDVRGWPFFNQL